MHLNMFIDKRLLKFNSAYRKWTRVSIISSSIEGGTSSLHPYRLSTSLSEVVSYCLVGSEAVLPGLQI